MAKSIQEQILKSINEGISKTPNIPRKKMSKRLAKKLATTGRTSTTQSIKGAKTPPLVKKSEDLPKVGPKPKSPKIEEPKVEEPKIDIKAKEAADEKLLNEEMRLKQFLTDMITSSDELTQAQKDAISMAIYEADTDLLNEIKDIFMEDEGTWKDFYLYQNETEAGYMDYMDYMAAIQTVMDVLNIEY